MRLDEASADAQAQTEAIPVGGDERIENAIQLIRWNTVTAIPDRHLHAVAVGHADLDQEPASLGCLIRHGIAGIEDQIEEHLLELHAIAQNDGQLGIKFRLQRNSLRDQVAAPKSARPVQVKVSWHPGRSSHGMVEHCLVG